MPKRTILNQIRKLDAARDHQRIVQLDNLYEFAFDTTRALEFALYRTFAVPSIGALLHQTQEFEQRAQKRYDDTDLIISEIVEHGYDSERGRAAIRRMNRQHGRFPIANNDLLYVLSTFIFEPIRWNARFGWRQMIEQEKLAAFYFWSKVGHYMNIKDIPATYDEYEHFNRDYERMHFHYSDANRRVAAATRAMILSWYLPAPLQRLGEPAVNALMDEPLLEAFGFAKPSPLMRRTVEIALRAKARFARLLPERKRPRSRTAGVKHRTYPNGYKIEELGPKIG